MIRALQRIILPQRAQQSKKVFSSCPHKPPFKEKTVKSKYTYIFYILPCPRISKYTDRAGEYRWRLKAPHNNIIADSVEVYNTKAGCLEGIEDVKRYAPIARIDDKT